MLFNTDLSLWQSLFASQMGQPREFRTPLEVINGHVKQGGDVIGRFLSTSHAEDILTKAGWQKHEKEKSFNVWIVEK